MKKLLIILVLISLTSITQAADRLTTLTSSFDLITPVVLANDTIKIAWQDLQGQVKPFDNPFDHLSSDQLYNLSVYGRIQQIEKLFPYKITEVMQKEATAAKAKLIAEKVDIDYLFEQRLLLIEKRKKAAMETNNLLADKNIEMSGFMLPLEFNNGLVTEFLLVPTMGACSHQPVPPANQMILVSAQKPIKAGSPYMAVKVSGLLRITPQAKDLYLVDGSKNIEMSYSLKNTIVEPFISVN